MKNSIKKWTIRLIVLIIVSGISVIGVILNPTILYAKKTKIGNFKIYHQSELNKDFYNRLEGIRQIIIKSEIYDPALELDICLNDGNKYPDIMKVFLPPAFGWSISNKAVFQGISNYKENTVELNGYKWNMEQLYAHEIIHCYQLNHFGLLNSNPFAGHPEWKWEGYAEYASRKEDNHLSLIQNIKRIDLARTEAPQKWGVFFEDETVAPRSYYDHWLLVQYCLDIKNMTYEELIQSDLSKTSVEEELRSWYLIQDQKDL